jgi:hypothetical protein
MIKKERRERVSLPYLSRGLKRVDREPFMRIENNVEGKSF